MQWTQCVMVLVLLSVCALMTSYDACADAQNYDSRKFMPRSVVGVDGTLPDGSPCCANVKGSNCYRRKNCKKNFMKKNCKKYCNLCGDLPFCPEPITIEPPKSGALVAKENTPAEMKQKPFCHQGKCYRLFNSKKTWDDAKKVCESFMKGLAEPRSKDESDIMKMLALNNKKASPWIGANDKEVEGTWRWNSGELVSAGFSDWFKGQPDNKPGDADCAFVNSKVVSLQWFDDPCTAERQFVCYEDETKA